MKVLIACEYSGTVRDSFIAMGHDVMSCDLLPTDKPGPHYHGNVLDIINDGWDLMIAHPPCTYLSVSGMHWTTRGLRNPQLTEDALEFVKQLMNAPVSRIAIENPISVISSKIRKPDQIIQPYWFGDSASKSTCLWLKNLPKLKPTNMVDKGEFKEWIDKKTGKNKRQALWFFEALQQAKNSAERRTLRSKTFKGMAEAMATQWTNNYTIQNKLF